MSVKRSILTTILLIVVLISGCSRLDRQSFSSQDSVIDKRYDVIDKSTGEVSQYLLTITNCGAISLDVITEWVGKCEAVDGYYDYIYSDPDSWDIFLYIPNAQELFGDIQNSNVEIEVTDSILKVYIDITDVSTKEKKSGELIIHLVAPLRGSWPIASELYVDGTRVERLSTTIST